MILKNLDRKIFQNSIEKLSKFWIPKSYSKFKVIGNPLKTSV